MLDRDSDEYLLAQLSRISAAACKLTDRDDRRHILALESDLRLIRATLTARCDALAEKMNAASAQANAATAYARCATLRTEPARFPQSDKKWSD
jgi:hypothetical protein